MLKCMDYIKSVLNRLLFQNIPFCTKTLMMEILITASIFFYIKKSQCNSIFEAKKSSDLFVSWTNRILPPSGNIVPNDKKMEFFRR